MTRHVCIIVILHVHFEQVCTFCCVGGQLLLLAWGGGGGRGVWEAESEAAANEYQQEHSGEEDGSGGGHPTAWGGQASECLVSHSDAANELARAGAAPPYSHPLPHRPPDQCPDELLYQTYCNHVQVCM